ncbi:hypothetical protein D3C81_2051960 [compost metagenome]
MLYIACAVIAAAEDFHLLNYVNVLSGKITVSDEVNRSCKGCNSAADKINLLVTVLFFHKSRLHRVADYYCSVAVPNVIHG